jgi:hypothetical protein
MARAALILFSSQEQEYECHTVEVRIGLHPAFFTFSHKVLTNVEYRAVSGVFQNIDPPPSTPSECVLPTEYIFLLEIKQG